MAKHITGTLEWADENYNCLTGCEHNCRYCYARYMAVTRLKRVASREAWGTSVVRRHDVARRMGKIAEHAVMFPTTHDITPRTLEPCLAVLRHLLDGGNKVLLVSKPHLDCVQVICREFAEFKEMILLRFTVGAYDNGLLRYWEPGAPSFEERLAALKHAFHTGFDTSVSVEPMLDSKNVVTLFEMLEPYVTDAIWIGKMNRVRQRVVIDNEEDDRRVAEIEAGQADERIEAIHAELCDEPKVKWKESIKKVVGLDLAHEAGLDV